MAKAMIHWTLQAFRNFLDFRGRSGRPEYWWFTATHYIVYIFFIIAADRVILMASGAIYAVVAIILASYLVAAIIPSISVTVRRLHDTGKSGWWYFLTFVPVAGNLVLLYFTLEMGDRETNRFGPPIISRGVVA